MRALINDIKYAFRQLRKSPGFTAVAVLSLSLGIGVNTAIFSMINGILYKSLPVRNPHELRVINWTFWVVQNPDKMRQLGAAYSWLTKPGEHSNGSFPYFAYLDFARQTQGFSDIFAFSNGEHRVTINADGIPTLAKAGMVSGNFFKSYGERVLIGRPIMPDDDRRDAPPVTVITYPFWQRVYGLDPHVIGRALMVGKTGFTVIGVLPRHYLGPTDGESRTDFYVPLAVGTWLSQDNFWWVQMMGRLAPGADEVQIRTSLELLFSQVIERSGAVIDRPGILLQGGRHGALSYDRSDWGEVFWGLQRVVGLVLLIACTNLAGLLLARGAARQHEMAVRAALGAGRWRLIRQSLIESLILSLGGVCLGLVFSVWLRRIVSGFIVDLSSDNQRFDLRIDGRVLLFALAIGVATTLLSGLFPAWRAGHTDPSARLKESGSRSAPRLRLGKVLVTAQMGMSVLFVVVGGLLCRTLINLSRVDPGFDTENLLLVPIDPSRSLSPPRNRILFFEAVRRQIAAIPGVRFAAVSDATLTRGPASSDGVSIPGHPEVEPREAPRVNVSEGYFATVGIRLQGRDFLPTDRSKNVVIVNEEFARVFFPQENPLGQFIMIDDEQHGIVGLCGNQKYGSLRNRISPILYRPYSRIRPIRVVCLVRSVLPPSSLVPAVHRAVAAIDPSLLLEGIMTQKLAIKESLRMQRLATSLAGSFALLALVLCCIGLYGLMAYNVARRTGEMGIRKALGARPWDVARPIFREALILAVIGVAIGLPVALALVRLIKSVVYGIKPYDPLTMIGAAGLMIVVAVFAAWIPARRAAKVDPMEALRYE